MPDRSRPLGPRGLADAPHMSRRIAEIVGPIDVAVVSPATRTQQTWELLSPGLGAVPDVRTDERIYQAWGQDMMSLLPELPNEATTVLILGHEPGVSELVLSLADRSAPDLRRRIAEKFPTCAAAVLHHEGPWAGLGAGRAALAAFLTPRDKA